MSAAVRKALFAVDLVVCSNKPASQDTVVLSSALLIVNAVDKKRGVKRQNFQRFPSCIGPNKCVVLG